MRLKQRFGSPNVSDSDLLLDINPDPDCLMLSAWSFAKSAGS